MPSLEWVQPSPIWGATSDDVRTPWLAELDGDTFLTDFLDLLGERTPGKTPADLAQLGPTPTGDTLKLYQAAHGRYYLVVGSLVCRQLGLPDHTVDAAAGERTAFVLRRVSDAGPEQGWVKDGPNKGWQDAPPDDLVLGEERLPLHHVAVGAPPPPPVDRATANALRLLQRIEAGVTVGSTAVLLPTNGRRAARPRTGPAAPPTADDRRIVYYGYVPVDSREKYLAVVADPVAALGQVPPPQSGERAEGDPRLGEVEARVIETWRHLYVDPVVGTEDALQAAYKNLTDAQLAPVSLYVILDLGDFLERNLPDVFAALGPNPVALPAGSQRQALLDEFGGITIQVRRPGAGAKVPITLAQALAELKPALPLVHGQGAEPADQYDVFNATHVVPGNPATTVPVAANHAEYLKPGSRLYTLLTNALAEEKDAITQAGGNWLVVPPEVADMIRLDPPGGDRYCIRLVYEEPTCPPLLSQPSKLFTFAKFLDPDAPARHIRIELPSLGDLRKFKRGIGMEMPPDLRTLMDRVNQGMLDGGGLGPAGPSWQLGMICSFSIQIIMLVAFIVMFIFLIALNFIFWWLAFLKICFPIPVKK